MILLQTICKMSNCLLHTHHDSFNALHRKRSIHESFWNQFVGKRLTGSWQFLVQIPLNSPSGHNQFTKMYSSYSFGRERERCSFKPRPRLSEPKHRLLQYTQAPSGHTYSINLRNTQIELCKEDLKNVGLFLRLNHLAVAVNPTLETAKDFNGINA